MVFGVFACVVMTYKYHDGVFSQMHKESIDSTDSVRYFVTPKTGQRNNTLRTCKVFTKETKGSNHCIWDKKIKNENTEKLTRTTFSIS